MVREIIWERAMRVWWALSKYFLPCLLCSSAVASDLVPAKSFLEGAALVTHGRLCAIKEDKRMIEFIIIEPVVKLTEEQVKRLGAVLSEPGNYETEAIWGMQTWDAKAVLSNGRGDLLEVVFSSQYGHVLLRLNRIEGTAAILKNGYGYEEILKVLIEALPDNQHFKARLELRLKHRKTGSPEPEPVSAALRTQL